jgi:hypothetical protein
MKLLLSAVLFCSISYSLACECFPKSLDQAFCESDFAIELFVKSKEMSFKNDLRYKIDVLKLYSKNESETKNFEDKFPFEDIIWTGHKDPACVRKLEEGKNYIITGNLDGSKATTSLCEFGKEGELLNTEEKLFFSDGYKIQDCSEFENEVKLTKDDDLSNTYHDEGMYEPDRKEKISASIGKEYEEEKDEDGFEDEVRDIWDMNEEDGNELGGEEIAEVSEGMDDNWGGDDSVDTNGDGAMNSDEPFETDEEVNNSNGDESNEDNGQWNGDEFNGDNGQWNGENPNEDNGQWNGENPNEDNDQWNGDEYDGDNGQWNGDTNDGEPSEWSGGKGNQEGGENMEDENYDRDDKIESGFSEKEDENEENGEETGNVEEKNISDEENNEERSVEEWMRDGYEEDTYITNENQTSNDSMANMKEENHQTTNETMGMKFKNLFTKYFF